MLEKLPPELLNDIIEQNGGLCLGDVLSLSLVSKRVRVVVLPILFRDIVARPPNDLELDDIRSDKVNYASGPQHLRYTRDLAVSADFVTNIRPYTRCSHYRPEFEERLPTPFNLLSTLRLCEPNGLRSFSWELGVCIPPEILGPKGYLNQHQKNIESLSLITDGSCSRRRQENGTALPLLTGFPYLTKLCWAGICSPPDIKSLKNVLAERRSQLQHLDLDFEYQILMRSESYEDYVLDGILSQFQPVQMMFPALQHLTLCSVSFVPREPETDSVLLQCFDFLSLTSLKIRHCPGYDQLLKCLIDSDRTVKLQSFELQARSFDQGVAGGQIVPFLASFSGLRELYLALAMRIQAVDIWRAMGSHSQTLTRYAYHQSRVLDPHRPNQLRWQYTDDMDLSYLEIDDFGPDPAGNPLGDLNLTVIGLSCAPEWMRAAVSPFTRKNSLEVLHLRRSGPDCVRDESNEEVEEPEDTMFFLRQRQDQVQGNQRPLMVIAEDISHSFNQSTLLNLASRSPRKQASASYVAQDPPEIYADYFWENEEDSPKYIWPWLDIFLQWLFGPTGVSSLRLFAFGDFSHRERFIDYNYYFIRNENYSESKNREGKEGIPSYLEVGMYHPEVVYQLEKHERTLAACPLDSLFDFDH